MTEPLKESWLSEISVVKPIKESYLGTLFAGVSVDAPTKGTMLAQLFEPKAKATKKTTVVPGNNKTKDQCHKIAGAGTKTCIDGTNNAVKDATK